MSRRRVVITGAGNITALGHDWQTFKSNLQAGRSAVQAMPAWRTVEGLHCYLGAPVDLQLPSHYTRRVLRSMGRVAQLSVYATELALADAGLADAACLTDGRTGVAYGSATGSPDALLEFVSTLEHADARPLKATSYLRGMSHTAAVNIGVHFGLTGRVLPTSSACTASSQAIGFAYETICAGYQDVMLAGGADELTVAHSAVFDALLATSAANATPTQTPRPFDAQRDGLVLGEGASTLVLEDFDHAQQRGAAILGEVVGFATNSDGAHITQPQAQTQAQCLQAALRSAGLDAVDIGYVNAHGTATDRGDPSEVMATREVLPGVQFSSLKGHLGHTLGACGGIEAWATLMMLRDGWAAPTLNLAQIDDECLGVQHVIGAPTPLQANFAMSNNFAFGGINTSLILAPPPV
ncbi:MAG: beta-ketoacyl-ACP synthase [Pseudomonadota bacterium]